MSCETGGDGMENSRKPDQTDLDQSDQGFYYWSVLSGFLLVAKA